MKLSIAILFCSTISAVTALAAAAAPFKMQLKYFSARGAAETIRIILAVGGEDYDDIRYEITPGTMDAPAFKEAKNNGDLVMNLDRAPILVTGPEPSDIIGQSKAIERFLARRYNLMGSSEVQAAQIDCVAEHCRDVKDAMMRKRFSAFVRDRTDEQKAADQKQWFEEEMPAMLAKMERAIALTSKAKGCAVGDSLSLADLAIFSLLYDGFPIYKEPTLKAAERCSMLLEIVDSVKANPKVAEWLETRPESSF